MTTYYQFSPSENTNYSFEPTLDGQQYTVIVTWNLFGQRWYVNVYSLQGTLIVEKPLRGSPEGVDLNLIEGYFSSSTMVYRVATNNFEVSP